MEVTTRLTMDDFVHLYEEEGPFEIIDGERIDLVPPLAEHTDIANDLAFAINSFTVPRQMGKARTESPFVLPDAYDSDWVQGARVPDVAYYLAERLAAYKEKHPDWRQKPYLLVPDLAVEIVSRHDTYTQIDRKVWAYLEDGVRLVWVIDPRRQTVSVYDGEQFLRLSRNDTLTGGEVIPGFALPVARIFADE